jgi:glycosyltransferase involved in cell wall biosynthesis
MAVAPDVSLIVPAHNEAAGIGATLAVLRHALAETAPSFELIVACNGCTDDTAAVARKVAPEALVLDIPARGKANALNCAFAVASGRSILVIDADTHPDQIVLRALAKALDDPGVLAISPGVAFNFDKTSSIVRSCYRVFALHPYLQSGVGGAGIYGLTFAGRAALGAFPLITADDEFVRRALPESAQRRVQRDANGRPVLVTIRPPSTLRSLIRAEMRSRRGDREVRALLGSTSSATSARASWLVAAARQRPLDFIVFVVFKMLSRLWITLTPTTRGQGWIPSRD